jgi:hypothetical protein
MPRTLACRGPLVRQYQLCAQVYASAGTPFNAPLMLRSPWTLPQASTGTNGTSCILSTIHLTEP